MFKLTKKILIIALMFSSSTQGAGIEALDAASADNLDPKYFKFMDWMKSSGGEISKIELREERSSMRGVYAVEDVKKGETILFVPDKLMKSVDKGLESPIGKMLVEKNLVSANAKVSE